MNPSKMDFEESRDIYIEGDIGTKNMVAAYKKIIMFNEMDVILEDSKSFPAREPIKIYITSGGGEVDPSFGLIDIILNSKTPIHTIAIGKACSAAFMILMAGHKRIMTKNTTLMYHELSHGVRADLTHMKRVVKIDEKLMHDYDQHFLENSIVTEEMLTDIKEKRMDWYISASEALKLEIVHEII